MKNRLFPMHLLMVLGALFSLNELQAQCVYPTHNVVVSSPGSYTSWQPSGGGTTGGTRSRTIQIGSSPNIYMRITWVARSSSNVTISSWDYTSGGYGASWQPYISFPRSNSSTDTSWAEFLVEFASQNGSGANSFDNNPYTFPCLASSIIDIDGSGNSSGSNAYRETVWVTSPSKPYGISGSSVSSGIIGNWIVNVSGFPVFNNIDSSIHAAQVQMNFTNVHSYNIRAGIIGTRSSSTTRQNSFWFLPFGTLTTPLPVVYINQSLTGGTNNITYRWTTSSEENNDYFEVEKSTDGVFWNKIGKVHGSGNSYENVSYEFIDNNPIHGYNLYRLKQFDFNGEFQYSPIQKYFWDGNEAGITIYPNPSENVFYISGIINPDIKVYSLATTQVVAEAKQSQQIDLSDLPNGIYYIEISNGIGSNIIVREKIIKQ